MDARRYARIGLVGMVAVVLALGAFAAVPAAVGMGRGNVTFVGVIEALPGGGLIGQWTVAGVKVSVNDQTTIDQERGEAAVGAMVNVKGELQPDLSVAAERIDVLKSMAPPHGPPQEKSFAVLHLTATAAAPPDAAGVVVTRTFTFGDGTLREDLKVGVCGLAPGTDHEVLVDDVAAGVIHTDEDGEGHLFLSTAGQPGAEPLPAELQPLTERESVAVRAAGVPVLVGDFDDARRHDTNHPWLDYLGLAVLQDGDGAFVGFAAAAIDGEEQELKFGLWGLVPGDDYTLLVDGLALGTFAASPRGTLTAEFSTEPRGHELPLPEDLLPVSGLMAASVQRGAEEVAAGEFVEVPKALTSGGGRFRRRFGH